MTNAFQHPEFELDDEKQMAIEMHAALSHAHDCHLKQTLQREILRQRNWHDFR